MAQDEIFWSYWKEMERAFDEEERLFLSSSEGEMALTALQRFARDIDSHRHGLRRLYPQGRAWPSTKLDNFGRAVQQKIGTVEYGPLFTLLKDPLNLFGYHIQWRHTNMLHDLIGALENFVAGETGRDETRERIDEMDLARGYHMVTRKWFRTLSQRPDQIEAIEYEHECYRLSQGEAGARARELLLSHLSETQRQEYMTRQSFHVICQGRNPEIHDLSLPKRAYFTHRFPRYLLPVRRYRVDGTFPNGNIILEHGDTGIAMARFCVHPPEPYPMGDILLTQKLMLEMNEAEVLRQGNLSPAWG